jgi:hypothetical protein
MPTPEDRKVRGITGKIIASGNQSTRKMFAPLPLFPLL